MKKLKMNLKCLGGSAAVVLAFLSPNLIAGNDQKSLFETAVAADDFNTLVAAVKAAGLTETLTYKGPFTVFAPTDEAFAKLPAHTLAELLKPENKDQLTEILSYHVVPGEVTAAGAIQAGTAKTLMGDRVTTSIKAGRLTINGANVLVNDLESSNGIIHVIDTVLLPPKKHSSNRKMTGKSAGKIALLSALDPAAVPNLQSESADVPVSLTFCNLSHEPMLVSWINYNGDRQPWREQIEPGKLATCERTYGTHAWIVSDTHGNDFGVYLVGGEDSLIVNR